ncbi:amidohydrolase family protein [Ensifer adhaerens]|uniref:amidohydrolase family protein n=1 Tax=Ensifer adhaerens TaxID=106592 RepID=UPI001CC11C8A|nr:amidohydrolase family protein [Ensifer adhaerens]MBZ7926379.1 amidohydrolase family protein [Ensifer adhaerens]UAX97262.1 amidohydrolase family protein [Ensifer adhaerens]UAY03619.1 amidohydrolase family protein [Ensifer adhaerens]UAY11603.1 amidohydrolase family protein [Ensifer adhaerens]
MHYIDAFNHFFPKALWDRIQQLEGAGKDIGRRMQGVPCIHDLETRFRVMDQFRDYTQILSLGMPPLEAMGGPEQATELARIGNDGLAALVSAHPDRFAGFVAALPMNAPEAAAREAERAFTDLGANGLQIHTNVNGAPLDEERFFPIFETAARHGKPVLLHPSRTASMPDYATEDKSKYEIWWTFGWPYETSAAMARLVFSGFMDRLPDLKVLAHHMGAMVPYFEGRVGPGWDQLGKRTSDEDLSLVLQRLKKRPLDYFKDFYADTAVFGSRAATLCGLEFYGSDRILFASDSPFDPEKGPGYIRDTIKILEGLDLPAADMEKICFRNAENLFGLKA